MLHYNKAQYVFLYNN